MRIQREKKVSTLVFTMEYWPRCSLLSSSSSTWSCSYWASYKLSLGLPSSSTRTLQLISLITSLSWATCYHLVWKWNHSIAPTFCFRESHSKPDSAHPHCGVRLRLSAGRLEEEGGEVAEDNREDWETAIEVWNKKLVSAGAYDWRRILWNNQIYSDQYVVSQVEESINALITDLSPSVTYIIILVQFLMSTMTPSQDDLGSRNGSLVNG